MTTWNVTDELIGHRVICYDGYGDEFEATVIGVHPNSYTIRVRDDDGLISIGNQWDDI